MPSRSTRYAAQPGDYGSEFIPLSSGSQNAVAVNSTRRFGLGGINDKDDTDRTHQHVGYIDSLYYSTYVVPVDADGTIIFTFRKFDASANAQFALTAVLDLELLVQGKTERAAFLASLTDQQLTMDTGDFLYAEVVNNSAAIDTQPEGLVMLALIKLVK